MIKLHLGCGKDIKEGYVNIDLTENDGADLAFDLEGCDLVQLPFEDGSVTEIHAAHVLEHINKILPLMEELWRVAAHDCPLKIWVPGGRHNSAIEDPTHIRYFTEHSFWYYCQDAYARADYGYKGDWHTRSIIAWVQEPVARMIQQQGIDFGFALNHFNNVIDEFEVVMTANKQKEETPPYPRVRIQIEAEEAKDGQ